MKILMLSTGERDGAGRAACRLHEGLQQMGLDAQISIQQKQSNDPRITGPQTALDKTIAKLNLSYRLDSLPLSLYHRTDRTPFSLQWLPGRTLQRTIASAPDIINLQWICQGYVSIEAISRIKQPLSSPYMICGHLRAVVIITRLAIAIKLPVALVRN